MNTPPAAPSAPKGYKAVSFLAKAGKKMGATIKSPMRVFGGGR